MVTGVQTCALPISLRRPDVLFAGLRSGEDLATHYASADVFLFPSQTETFGNVVTEAMASGLAVVAYNRAAAAQLIRHGHNGLLVHSGDAAAFCSVSCRLAGNRDWASAMGAASRQSAQGLGWAGVVEAVEAEYHSALTPSQHVQGATLPAAVPMA
jgi:glycosyltransferase involved in cell wall biosynthesis